MPNNTVQPGPNEFTAGEERAMRIQRMQDRIGRSFAETARADTAYRLRRGVLRPSMRPNDDEDEGL
jgi:hypothetical protein